jgi:hypothetical protein
MRIAARARADRVASRRDGFSSQRCRSIGRAACAHAPHSRDLFGISRVHQLADRLPCWLASPKREAMWILSIVLDLAYDLETVIWGN